MAEALGLAPNLSHHLLRGLSCPSLEGFGNTALGTMVPPRLDPDPA